MSFDISKTETFIPLLWIFAKTVVIVLMFNTISAHYTLPIADTALKSIPVFDRIVFMLILQMVVMEQKLDMCIIKSSDVGQKIAHKTLVGLNIHVITDVFFAFCLRLFVREHRTVGDSDYVFVLFYLMWFLFGCVFFCHEILQQAGVGGKDNSVRLLPKKCRLVQQNVLYILGIFLMTASVSAPSLAETFAHMPNTEYYLRLFLYAFCVCCRCYTQGIAGAVMFSHDMPNMIIFGWTILVPTWLLYVYIMVSLASYMRLFSALHSTHAYTDDYSSFIPLTQDLLQGDGTDALPVQTAAGHPFKGSFRTPHSLQGSFGADNERLGAVNSDFMLKLRDMEQTISTPHTSDIPLVKNAKRRTQASLF